MSEPSSHCYDVGALGAGGIVPLKFEFMSCFMYGLKLLTKAILELRFTINCKLANHTRAVAGGRRAPLIFTYELFYL